MYFANVRFNPALARLVANTPETERHLLIVQLVGAINQHLVELPADLLCTCGADLAEQGAGVSLDYSTGEQAIEFNGESWEGSTEANDQHTVADVMCTRCKRLYRLGGDDTIQWD